MKRRRSWSWPAVALLALLMLPGCLGPNHATGHLAKWNFEFENKWAREGVFLVCLPAYVVFAVGDMVIFNSIQWWSGDPFISRPVPKNDSPSTTF